GAVKLNLAKLVPTPRGEKRLPSFLTVDEVVKLLDTVSGDSALDARDSAILELLYSSGLRVSELAGSDVGDVDLAGMTVKVLGKGRKERQVPIGSRAAEAVKKYLAHRL